MAKKDDVLEVEATVLRNITKCNVQSSVRKWSRNPCSRFW